MQGAPWLSLIAAALLRVASNGPVCSATEPPQAPRAAAPSAQPTAPSPPAHPLSPKQLLARQARVAEATVTLPARSCAGFVVGPERVATAAHCVPEGGVAKKPQRLPIILKDGTRLVAQVEHLERAADLALLRLNRPINVRPLQLATTTPRRGDRVLFVGRVDRPSHEQLATVRQLGRCPSLPQVPDAIFTTLNARKGDSGAPLVNARFRVVGLVHGGARCHIAAPVARLAARLTPSPSAPGASPAPGGAAPKPPAPGRRAPSGAGPSEATPKHRATAKQSEEKSERQPPPGVRAPRAPSDSTNKDQGTASGAAARDESRRIRFGPFMVEETQNGYRLEWSFSFGFDTRD